MNTNTESQENTMPNLAAAFENTSLAVINFREAYYTGKPMTHGEKSVVVAELNQARDSIYNARAARLIAAEERAEAKA